MHWGLLASNSMVPTQIQILLHCILRTVASDSLVRRGILMNQRIAKGWLTDIFLMTILMLAIFVACDDGCPMAGQPCAHTLVNLHYCSQNGHPDPLFFLNADEPVSNEVNVQDASVWYFYGCASDGCWRRMTECDGLCPQPSPEDVIVSCTN